MSPENNKFKQLKNNSIFSICSIIAIGVFNILCIFVLFLARSYFAIEMSAAIFIIVCIVIFVAIIDLIGIVGFKYKDIKLEIIGSAFSSILIIVLGITCFYLININSSINNIIDNKGVEQYELINVTLASYKKEYQNINDCNGKKVGVVADSEIGVTSVFKDEAEKNNIKPNYVEYNTTNDLFFALITEEVDIAVLPSNYRMLYEKDEEADYSQYLENVHNFYSMEEKVKTGENELANADLTLEPFNILLIGFAPEEGSKGKYGLSDTIIVATINPQTLEVGLTSIARDSYVPISCYSGYQDKINAARGKSRQCLMDTVGNLLDLDINLYMEANFQAVVDIVDAVGGIDINSPVAFTGQTSSEVRGTYTIQIPQGLYHANGEEALAFARERHAMPAGDFDRQDHQKQVIKEVVAKILETRDLNVVTKIIQTCGDNLSTNLSMQQITQLFNYLIKLENNTSLSLSDIVDMQNARLTGYSSWHYNYSAHLPLWIYKLYNGSISEAKQHISDIMNGYDAGKEQKPNAKFFTYYPYSRQDFYHTVFNEQQEHEEMPAFYINLVGKSYAEALGWANENGVSVNVNTILPGDAGYDESQFGNVISQDVPYGSTVTEYPSVTLTVMGNVNGNYAALENFIGRGYYYAVEWCNQNKVLYTLNFIENATPSLAGVVYNQSYPAGTVSARISNIVFDVYKFPPVTQDQINDLYTRVGEANIRAWASTYGHSVVIHPDQITNTQSQDGVVYNTVVSNNEATGNIVDVYIYKYQSSTPQPPQLTCPSGSSGEYPSCICNEGTYNQGSNTCDLPQPPDPPAPTSFSVSVSVNDGSMGSASASATTVNNGETVTLTATANPGFHFVGWSTGDATESLTITVTSDVSIQANFEADS